MTAGQAAFNLLPKNNKTASGTAILLNHSALVFGTIRKNVDGQVVAAEVKHKVLAINVVNTYAPTSSGSVSVREVFLCLCIIKFIPIWSTYWETTSI